MPKLRKVVFNFDTEYNLDTRQENEILEALVSIGVPSSVAQDLKYNQKITAEEIAFGWLYIHGTYRYGNERSPVRMLLKGEQVIASYSADRNNCWGDYTPDHKGAIKLGDTILWETSGANEFANAVAVLRAAAKCIHLSNL